MDGPEKNRADDDPKEDGKPAEPKRSQDRPDNRAGRGDGGEMLAQKKTFFGGNEVHAVIDFNRRGLSALLKIKPAREETPVGKISGEEDDNHGKSD